MALSTYTELKAGVADWLNRSDLTTQIPDFITLAEARIRRVLRGGKGSRWTIYKDLNSASKGWMSLPARKYGRVMGVNFLRDSSLSSPEGSSKPLLYLPFTEFSKRADEQLDSLLGQEPIYYSIWADGPDSSDNGSTITDWNDQRWLLVLPHTLSNDNNPKLEVLIERGVDPLATATGGTNWLLDEHPDVYLYGTLMQAAPFLRDDERVPLWEQLFLSAVKEMEAREEWEDQGPGRNTPLIARPKRALG